MAVSADDVVIELQAQTAAHDAALVKSADTFEKAMARIKRAAEGAEGADEERTRRNIARRLRLGAAVRGEADTVVAQSARAANATRNLGRQVQDIGVGLAGGQSPFLILAQQAPQVADALSDTGGKFARFATFFVTPAGAALLAFASIIGTAVIPALLESGNKLDDMVRDLEENAENSRIASEAQKIFETSLYGAADAAAKLNEKLKTQNQSQLDAARSALVLAQNLQKVNKANLDKELQEATRARNALAATNATAGVTGAFAAAEGLALNPAVAAGSAIQSQIEAADRRIAVARKGLADATSAAAEAQSSLTDLQVSYIKAGEQDAKSSERSTRAHVERAKAAETLAERLERLRREDERAAAEQDRNINSILNRPGGIAEQSKNFEQRIDAEADARFKAENEADRRLFEERQQQVTSLASFYESALRGGNKSIFESFKEEGIKAVALILARLTAARIGGGALDFLGGGGSISSTIANAVIGGAPGRASGGPVMAGKLYKVNESGIEGFRPAGSGTIVPLGRMNRAGGGGVTVIAPQQFDLRGVMMTADVLQQMEQRNRQYANAVAAQAGKSAVAAVPARMAQYQQDGQ